MGSGGGCLTAYSTVMMDGGGEEEEGKCILTHTTGQSQIKLHNGYDTSRYCKVESSHEQR